ncbi:Sumo-conjugating enzyme ubc9 [Diplonema papillatum]|nr:Sumo-conjugating enzyme ubc9 [Diplonema papillatum]
MAIAIQRLKEERKNWRKERPFGFVARPDCDENGEANLLEWEAIIPGKDGTLWAGGEYKLHMSFSKDYPSKPPKVQFRPVIFHPNVYPSGTVCLSILNEEKGWKPSITVKTILLAIQELLDNPNPKDPAQKDPYELFVKDREKYDERVRQDVRRFRKQ